MAFAGTGLDCARQGSLLLWLLALASGCSSATHTVGELAPERAHGSPSASTMAGSGSAGSGADQAQSARGDAAVSTAPGDVGSADGAVNPLLPDPITMLEPDFSCQGASMPATRRRLDLYLMVDTNLFTTISTTITAPLNNAWTQIRVGLSDYVDSKEAEGTGVGAGYFPLPGTVPGSPVACDRGSYDSPITPVDLLPNNAAKIKQSIPAPIGLGSPTWPALQGALAYEHSRAQGFTYKQAIVLITDKIADFACFTDPNAIVVAAHDGFTTAPGIPTYVIALSSPVIEDALSTIGGMLVRFEALDQVAAQGGTGGVHAVDLDDPNDSLTRALLDVQHDAEPCQYEVGADVAADPNRIALGTMAAGMDPLPLPRLAGASACGMGYYLDDPVKPTWATLCRDTCSAVKSAKRTVLWIDDCDMPVTP